MNHLHIALAFATLTLIFGVATVLLNSARLNIKAALDRERDAHLKATKTNSLLQKANDNAVKEIEDLTAKLQNAEAERLKAENKIRHLLNNIESLELQIPIRPRDRSRDGKGRFLPRDTQRAALRLAAQSISQQMAEFMDHIGKSESGVIDGDKLCYRPKSGLNDSIDFYQCNGYTIHQAADFLQKQDNKG